MNRIQLQIQTSRIYAVFSNYKAFRNFGVCKYLHFIANFVNDVQYFEQSCNTKCNTDFKIFSKRHKLSLVFPREREVD